MRIGFTGTRKGMTPEQKGKLLTILERRKPKEFHCGDCIGADKEAMQILGIHVTQRGKTCWTVGHIPNTTDHRAYYFYFDTKKPLPPLERNKNIVKACDVLIAAPITETEEKRSGTWFTVREARRQNKPIVIILPNGKIRKENM